jgi:hypothetical protein
MKPGRWLSPVLGLALGAVLQAQAVSAAVKTDVCAIFKKHAPKDLGLALDQAVSPTPEFCLSHSAANKTMLMLRVLQTKDAAQFAGMLRETAVNKGVAKVTDEPTLAKGAWSTAGKDRLQIMFAVNEQFVTVTFGRDGGLGDDGTAKARAFARAVAGELR